MCMGWRIEGKSRRRSAIPRMDYWPDSTPAKLPAVRDTAASTPADTGSAYGRRGVGTYWAQSRLVAAQGRNSLGSRSCDRRAVAVGWRLRRRWTQDTRSPAEDLSSTTGV